VCSSDLENQYSRSVTRDGNVAAQRLMGQVFETCDRPWRGIGLIPRSGYRLRPEFRDWDAEARFAVPLRREAGAMLCAQQFGLLETIRGGRWDFPPRAAFTTGKRTMSRTAYR
jgi:hydrogenase expression/formation protein HypD